MNTQSDFDNRVFSVTDAAAHLTIGRTFLYRLIAEERIRAVKLGTRTVITGREITRFLQKAQAA